MLVTIAAASTVCTNNAWHVLNIDDRYRSNDATYYTSEHKNCSSKEGTRLLNNDDFQRISRLHRNRFQEVSPAASAAMQSKANTNTR
jgi:hypothetical protein